jgi:hypothetical protein
METWRHGDLKGKRGRDKDICIYIERECVYICECVCECECECECEFVCV